MLLKDIIFYSITYKIINIFNKTIHYCLFFSYYYFFSIKYYSISLSSKIRNYNLSFEETQVIKAISFLFFSLEI